MEHPSDLTSLRRVHLRDAKNLLFHAERVSLQGGGSPVWLAVPLRGCLCDARWPRVSLVGGDWSQDVSSKDLLGGLRRSRFVGGETGGHGLQFLESLRGLLEVPVGSDMGSPRTPEGRKNLVFCEFSKCAYRPGGIWSGAPVSQPSSTWGGTPPWQNTASPATSTPSLG